MLRWPGSVGPHCSGASMLDGGALRSVFDAPDRLAAERRIAEVVRSYRKTAPRLADWIEGNVGSESDDQE